MVRSALILSLAMLAATPASAVVLMDSVPTAPANRPAPPPGASGGPRGHVMIENFENTLKGDMNVASEDATTAAAAAIIATPNITAVPEPETWAMMLGGFALAGAALRRRAFRITVSPSR
jgi:hypothetical protein